MVGATIDGLPQHDPSTPAATDEAAQLLADLERRIAAEQRPAELPGELPIRSIQRIELLFQPRGETDAEWHVVELMRVAKAGKLFDPLTVLQVGPTPILVDGHHRWEAYRRAKVTIPVPVAYFPGSVREAVLAAGEANHKTKLPMTTAQKQDRAWQLVKLGFSKSKVVLGAGISDGQAGNMKRALKKLGDEAWNYQTWFKAMSAWKGKELTGFGDDDDARRAYINGLVTDYARRMGKEFGTKLQRNPEVAARVLASYFGHHLGQVFAELRQLAKELPDWDDDADDAEF